MNYHDQKIRWTPTHDIISTTGNRTSDHRCGHWFDLQWWRLRYTLLMRPNKVETAVQCSRMSCVGVRPIFWSWLFNSQKRSYVKTSLSELKALIYELARLNIASTGSFFTDRWRALTIRDQLDFVLIFQDKVEWFFFFFY